jgi:poly [ADP-ribose] polymerase
MGVQILSEAEQGLAGEGHVLEKLYTALHTQLTPIDKSSDEWLVVNEFMGTSGLTVMDAFAVEREGEAMRFRPFSHLPNRMLLAHGTRLANTVRKPPLSLSLPPHGACVLTLASVVLVDDQMSILRQGLRIAPPEAPHTGYMFGKGST